MKNDFDLLIARLDALDRELTVVREVIESLANEKAEVAALWALSERVSDFARSTRDRIRELLQIIDAEQRSTFGERALPLLTRLERDVYEIADDAHVARAEGVRPSVPKDWDRTPRRFHEQAVVHASQLDDFRKTLETRRSAPIGPDRWRTLSALQERHAALLKDAFSFIAGVTTVKLEVDAGVIDLARDLLTELGSGLGGQELMVILAEGEVFLEGANAITLRLADTTVWNVPIAAHEYGHVVAQYPEVRRFLDHGVSPSDAPGGLSERHRHELFADVFATEALGPAFVLTSVMLRLDPAVAYDASLGHPSPTTRAHVMTQALAKGSYPRDALSARTLRATTKLWPFRPSLAEAAILDAFVEEAIKALGPGVLFFRESRDPGPELVELLERSTRGEDLVVDPEFGVIALLNAAWDCRTRGPAERARVDALSAGVLAVASRLRAHRDRPSRSAASTIIPR